MNPERFQRVTTLFERACKLEGEACEAYLAAQCGDDSDLRSEVEAMLEFDRRADGDVFSSGAGEGAHLLAAEIARSPDTCDNDSPDELPIRIGRYTVIRKLGEGGMGVVFEARQEKPSRVVALKVIRPGLTTHQELRRFEYESEILGHLRHAGIAQIFEAGTARIETVGGLSAAQPYFAMEFIRGKSLIDYARSGPDGATGAAVHERLALFAKVCDALQHAHQNGVIHRDLKPENILVDENGEPKILDFGVARLVDSESQLKTLQTDVGQLVGTLAYMSPEQLSGDVRQVDTRSDVYAAGVVLFQVLTGRLPFDVRGRALTDAAHTICNEAHAPVGLIDARLRGDIETIVAKALEKDKTRRYQTAGELARDLRHFLAGEPIEAKRDSAVYVLSKTLARHRALVGTATAIILVIVGSTVALSFMYAHQTRATAKARAEAVKANTVIELLQELVGAADPSHVKGRDYTVRQLLDEFGAGLRDQLADQPEVDATIHSTIGNAYLGLAEFDKAESHLAEALAIRRRVFGVEHLKVAAALGDLATLHMRRGQYDEAGRLYGEALDMQRRLVKRPDAGIATSLNNLGTLQQQKGDLTSAESCFRDALAMRRKLFGDKHRTIAQSIHNLALLLQHTGNYTEAEQLYREALGMNRELLVNAHPRIATNAYDLASLLKTKGDFEESEALFREALQINSEVYGDNHPSVSASMLGLGSLLRAVGRPDEAESLYRRALEIMRHYQNGEHPDQAVILNNLANVLKDKGEYEEAKALHYQALDMRRRLLGEDHWSIANSLTNLAGLLKTMGDVEQAEATYLEAKALGERVYSEDHPRLADILHGLGELLLDTRRHTEAEPLLERALAIRSNRLPPAHYKTIETASALGRCLTAEGEYGQAESLLLERFEVIETRFDPRTPRQRDALSEFVQTVVDLYEAWDKPTQAAEWRARLSGSHPTEPANSN